MQLVDLQQLSSFLISWYIVRDSLKKKIREIRAFINNKAPATNTLFRQFTSTECKTNFLLSLNKIVAFDWDKTEFSIDFITIEMQIVKQFEETEQNTIHCKSMVVGTPARLTTNQSYTHIKKMSAQNHSNKM